MNMSHCTPNKTDAHILQLNADTWHETTICEVLSHLQDANNIPVKLFISSVVT